MSFLPGLVSALSKYAPSIGSAAEAFAGPGTITEKLGNAAGAVIKSITGDLSPGPSIGRSLGYRSPYLERVYQPSGLEGDQQQAGPVSHLRDSYKHNMLRQTHNTGRPRYNVSDLMPIYEGHGPVQSYEAYRVGRTRMESGESPSPKLGFLSTNKPPENPLIHGHQHHIAHAPAPRRRRRVHHHHRAAAPKRRKRVHHRRRRA